MYLESMALCSLFCVLSATPSTSTTWHICALSLSHILLRVNSTMSGSMAIHRSNSAGKFKSVVLLLLVFWRRVTASKCLGCEMSTDPLMRSGVGVTQRANKSNSQHQAVPMFMTLWRRLPQSRECSVENRCGGVVWRGAVGSELCGARWVRREVPRHRCPVQWRRRAVRPRARTT